MYIMFKEETNNSSLVADLKPSLPPAPSKTPPLSPPPIPTPVPTLAAAFPALSIKLQLNSILNCKRKSPIYSSDAT